MAMKTALHLSLLAFLLLAAARPCFAMREIAQLSREQAEKEFGIKITSKLYGTDRHTVWMELKPTGKLKGFMFVNLVISSGGKVLVDAPLMADKLEGGGLKFYFTTDPAHLAASRLEIVVRHSERSMVGYELNVQDFIAPAAGK